MKPSWVVFVVFVVMALLWRVWPAAYGLITAIPDGLHRRMPFEDLAAILQAGTCWRHGVDVYHPSACLAGGVYNYSPLLLRAAYLPIGVQDTMPGGICFALAFIGALNLIPVAARDRRYFLAFALSPPVFYAIEQGNFDLIMFAATCAALSWFTRRPVLSLGIFALAAGLKFYPAALLSLALRLPSKLFWRLATVGAVAACVFLVWLGPGIAGAAAVLPLSQPFRATFGAFDLPLGLRLLHAAPVIKPYYPPASLLIDRRAIRLVAVGLSALCLWRGAAVAPRYRAALAVLPAYETICLWAGLAVMLFCFLVTQNVIYRSIFVLLAVPGLCRLGRPVLLAALLALMWEAVPRALLGGPVWLWLAREALWWWVMSEFAGILWGLVWQESKRFFFEKKQQKTCVNLDHAGFTASG
jgi:hypothetical protein